MLVFNEKINLRSVSVFITLLSFVDGIFKWMSLRDGRVFFSPASLMLFCYFTRQSSSSLTLSTNPIMFDNPSMSNLTVEGRENLTAMVGTRS